MITFQNDCQTSLLSALRVLLFLDSVGIFIHDKATSHSGQAPILFVTSLGGKCFYSRCTLKSTVDFDVDKISLSTSM